MLGRVGRIFVVGLVEVPKTGIGRERGGVDEIVSREDRYL